MAATGRVVTTFSGASGHHTISSCLHFRQRQASTRRAIPTLSRLISVDVASAHVKGMAAAPSPNVSVNSQPIRRLDCQDITRYEHPPAKQDRAQFAATELHLKYGCQTKLSDVVQLRRELCRKNIYIYARAKAANKHTSNTVGKLC